MEKFFDKLSSYEILNNLIPGSLFGILLPFFVPVEYPNWSGLEKIVIAYVAGVIISRFGSLLMSTISKNTNLISDYTYENYIVASERDKKIEILNSTGNMYRSLLSVFILLGAAWILHHTQIRLAIPQTVFNVIGLIALIILMMYAYKKQTKFICKRVNHHTTSGSNSPSVQEK